MANLQPQPGQMGNPLPTRHRSFSSLYSDPEQDPCQGRYDRIMARFDIDTNPGVTPVMLFEQAVGVGGAPQAYLCAVNVQQDVKIFCIHLPSRFVSALDGTVTPWDGRGFASLGEVTGTTVTTVAFPDIAFRPVMNTRAKTSDYIVTHLDELGRKGLAPAAANDVDSSNVNTRTFMYLPPRYVPLLLDASGYNLKSTWEILYPAIVDAHDLVNCQPLINWLRIASTGTLLPGNGPDLGPTKLVIELVAPLADSVLLQHRAKILNQVLPGLFQPSASLEHAITQMAVAVTQQTNDSRAAREQKLADSVTPKLPSDKFTITLGILQEYLEIPDECNLPPLWHQWANCSKRQELLILSELLGTYARGPDSFSIATPVPTSKVVQDLLAFSFVGDSPDDIKTGVQPFVIAEGSAEHRQANLEVARLYGLLNSGENSILLSDLEQLKAKEIKALPMNYFELERNLGMFGNFLGTVLGTNHALTLAYRSFGIYCHKDIGQNSSR
jgi:hypothetical protein